jgi:hypothetical protein
LVFIWFHAQSHPKLILWSWQRADDLSFIDDNISIAPLVATIVVDTNGVSVDPRRNALKTPKNAKLIPVVRLEISPHIQVSDDHVNTIVRHIQSFVVSIKADNIQIDFDARKSQRLLYEQILKQLRTTMPNTQISITALASWCVGDVWIDNLPITHAVPMLYNLGEHAHEFKRYFTKHQKWPSKKCQGHIGFEQNDIFTKPPKDWHVYVFNNKAWTANDLKKIKDTFR